MVPTVLSTHQIGKHWKVRLEWEKTGKDAHGHGCASFYPAPAQWVPHWDSMDVLGRGCPNQPCLLQAFLITQINSVPTVTPKYRGSDDRDLKWTHHKAPGYGSYTTGV